MNEKSSTLTAVSENEIYRVNWKSFQLRKAQHELAVAEQRRAGWRSPLIVAILAATVAALGNAVVTFVNASLERTIEAQKAESERILEMIKTDGDSDKAAENLTFLLEAGLIHDPELAGSLTEFLSEREPGTGPTLPGPRNMGGIVGFDDATRVANLPSDHPAQLVAPAVGLLRFTMESGHISACSAFLTTNGLLVTAAHCSSDGYLLMMTDGETTTSYQIRDLRGRAK